MSVVTLSVIKSHVFIHPASLYQPPNVYPIFVGSAGFVDLALYSINWLSTNDPPFELKIILFIELLTVTLQVEFLLPSSVVTVIVAIPVLTAVIFPTLSTVTIVGFEDVHATTLFIAFVGFTVASKISVAPTIREAEVLFKLTEVTLTIGLSIVTVTVQVEVLLPSTVVAVMVTVPAPIAVIFPALSTVAMVLSDDVHVTALFVALLGLIVDVKVSVSPIANASVDLSKAIDVTWYDIVKLFIVFVWFVLVYWVL